MLKRRQDGGNGDCFYLESLIAMMTETKAIIGLRGRRTEYTLDLLNSIYTEQTEGLLVNERVETTRCGWAENG